MPDEVCPSGYVGDDFIESTECTVSATLRTVVLASSALFNCVGMLVWWAVWLKLDKRPKSLLATFVPVHTFACAMLCGVYATMIFQADVMFARIPALPWLYAAAGSIWVASMLPPIFDHYCHRAMVLAKAVNPARGGAAAVRIRQAELLVWGEATVGLLLLAGGCESHDDGVQNIATRGMFLVCAAGYGAAGLSLSLAARELSRAARYRGLSVPNLPAGEEDAAAASAAAAAVYTAAAAHSNGRLRTRRQGTPQLWDKEAAATGAAADVAAAAAEAKSAAAALAASYQALAELYDLARLLRQVSYMCPPALLLCAVMGAAPGLAQRIGSISWWCLQLTVFALTAVVGLHEYADPNPALMSGSLNKVVPGCAEMEIGPRSPASAQRSVRSVQWADETEARGERPEQRAAPLLGDGGTGSTVCSLASISDVDPATASLQRLEQLAHLVGRMPAESLGARQHEDSMLARMNLGRVPLPHPVGAGQALSQLYDFAPPEEEKTAEELRAGSRWKWLAGGGHRRGSSGNPDTGAPPEAHFDATLATPPWAKPPERSGALGYQLPPLHSFGAISVGNVAERSV